MCHRPGPHPRDLCTPPRCDAFRGSHIHRFLDPQVPVTLLSWLELSSIAIVIPRDWGGFDTRCNRPHICEGTEREENAISIVAHLLPWMKLYLSDAKDLQADTRGFSIYCAN